MWSFFGKKSQQIWTQHCQLTPDPGQICLTKPVIFEIFNFGDWSCPPFWVEVSRWPLSVVGWHWQVDFEIYVFVVVHFWGEYEVLMVNCAWCDRDKKPSNTCSDGKWQVNLVEAQNCVSYSCATDDQFQALFCQFAPTSSSDLLWHHTHALRMLLGFGTPCTIQKIWKQSAMYVVWFIPNWTTVQP